jgi:transposase
MDHVGIDVHKRESQICIVTADGEVIEKRIRTERDRFAAVFGERARSKILIEASTESEWVACCLEELGHEVIVADPNFALMYATRSRRIKTDRRDAAALADACRGGHYRAAHRTSPKQRTVRSQLTVRETLVRTRSRMIVVSKALLSRHGIRVRTGESETFPKRVRAAALPDAVQAEVQALLTVLEQLQTQIDALDDAIEQLSKTEAPVRTLCTVPGVGPVTASAFVAAVDDAKRFRDAHQLQAYFGLVPSESSSGDKRHRGAITKSGPPRVRTLLVQAAHSVLNHRRASSLHLREWAMRIKQRRGHGVAIVALARRLAGVLWAMMRDGKNYESPAGRLAASS